MAGLLGKSKNSSSVPTYTQIQLQTSALGVCIPIGWGQFRAGANLIYYTDFAVHKQSGGKKGGGGGKGGVGGKGGPAQTTYSATIILALCEGPIQDIGIVYVNQTTTTLAGVGFTLFTGTQGQAPWGYLTASHPSDALSYSETAYVAEANYDLGAGATLPQHNFEIKGALNGSVPGRATDANPADIVSDLLTNPQYSLGLPSSSIDAASLANYKVYCQAQGIFLSPYLSQQEQVTSILQRWSQITNTWIFWSGNVLKFVPLGPSPIVANSANYTPNVSPVYDLTYDDFIIDDSSSEPLTVTRSDPSDGYNRAKLHILDRSNSYNNSVVEWSDQTSIDQYGVLQAQEIQATEICDAQIGNISASLIGMRATYLRNTYAFKLAYGYVLLEPGDIVTLTDPNIGLDRVFVRIQTIDEDDKGLLSIVAEEFPFDCFTQSGIGDAAAGAPPPSLSGGSPINMLVLPGDINPPAIFEPSPVLTNGAVPQVWLDISGGANWGGADIYISFDNVSFRYLGTQTKGAVQGVLTAALPLTADPDTVDTLSIDLTESVSVLPSTATTADADAFRTLSIIDDEMISYGTVTPGAGPHLFDLTYLRRGLYGTAIASHAIGDEFTRIDPTATFVYDLPVAYIGQTLYFKFPSFNLFGNERQDIATVPTYIFNPTGVGFFIAPPTSPVLSVSRVTQADGTTVLAMTLAWTASLGPLLGSYEVQFSADGGVTWITDNTVGAGALSFTLAPAVAGTNYEARVRAISQNGVAVSTWATSAAVNSGTLTAAVPAAPTGLTATALPAAAALAWTDPADPAILSYQIWRAAGLGASFGTANQIATIGAPATAFTDTTAAGSTAYTYFLVAVNAAGSSAASAGASVTTLAAPLSGVISFDTRTGVVTLQASDIAALDLSTLPTSDPGSGKVWLNGGVLQVGA